MQRLFVEDEAIAASSRSSHAGNTSSESLPRDYPQFRRAPEPTFPQVELTEERIKSLVDEGLDILGKVVSSGVEKSIDRIKHVVHFYENLREAKIAGETYPYTVALVATAVDTANAIPIALIRTAGEGISTAGYKLQQAGSPMDMDSGFGAADAQALGGLLQSFVDLDEGLVENIKYYLTAFALHFRDDVSKSAQRVSDRILSPFYFLHENGRKLERYANGFEQWPKIAPDVMRAINEMEQKYFNPLARIPGYHFKPRTEFEYRRDQAALMRLVGKVLESPIQLFESAARGIGHVREFVDRDLLNIPATASQLHHDGRTPFHLSSPSLINDRSSIRIGDRFTDAHVAEYSVEGLQEQSQFSSSSRISHYPMLFQPTKPISFEEVVVGKDFQRFLKTTQQNPTDSTLPFARQTFSPVYKPQSTHTHPITQTVADDFIPFLRDIHIGPGADAGVIGISMQGDGSGGTLGITPNGKFGVGVSHQSRDYSVVAAVTTGGLALGYKTGGFGITVSVSPGGYVGGTITLTELSTASLLTLTGTALAGAALGYVAYKGYQYVTKEPTTEDMYKAYLKNDQSSAWEIRAYIHQNPKSTLKDKAYCDDMIERLICGDERKLHYWQKIRDQKTYELKKYESTFWGDIFSGLHDHPLSSAPQTEEVRYKKQQNSHAAEQQIEFILQNEAIAKAVQEATKDYSVTPESIGAFRAQIDRWERSHNPSEQALAQAGRGVLNNTHVCPTAISAAVHQDYKLMAWLSVPEFTQAYKEKNYDQMIQEGKKLLTKNHIDPLKEDISYAVGCALVQKGQYSEASVYLRDVVRINPNYTEAHFILGRVQTRNEAGPDERREGLQHLVEAKRLNSQDQSVYSLLMQEQFKAGKLDEALCTEEEYKKKFHVDGMSTEEKKVFSADRTVMGWYRGVIHEQQHKYNEAVQDYTEMLSHDPNSVSARIALVSLYTRQDSTSENRKRVIPLCDEIIKLQPDNKQAHLCIAQERLQSGDTTGALKVIEAYKEKFGIDSDVAKLSDASIVQRCADRLKPPTRASGYDTMRIGIALGQAAVKGVEAVQAYREAQGLRVQREQAERTLHDVRPIYGLPAPRQAVAERGLRLFDQRGETAEQQAARHAREADRAMRGLF
ncbi:MAG: hypothetical protein A2103_04855 [Gammaproteobacteria bacterium GWF2_41_13]|nr:MAG: hypothetical protein A2103_04855 [Gammaproteobacteria bacterium GWF2_41_13]